MSSLDSTGKLPQDVVAIFHASFHPTQGNIVDWSLKASEELSLDHLEFSALPSGLHLVEEDVVYFTKDGNHGVCVFRRRKTDEPGHRGCRLSSLGILLAKSVRPRPWRHVAALKELISVTYSRLEHRGHLEPMEGDWEPATAFFNARKVRRADLAGAGDWNGWSHEFEPLPQSLLPDPNPTLHLSHFLRILGPSSLALYKHVLGRRRILIFTLPPVEAACMLCQIAADMCFESQVCFSNAPPPESPLRKLSARNSEGISVLGMVTLNDVDRMKAEGETGRGWIACTTDAIFLEKPSYYDLVIDLTTSTPNKATRPTFYASKAIPHSPKARGPTHRLSVIRFSWSDIKLWNEIDRLLQLDTGHHHLACCGPSDVSDEKSKFITAWTDAWKVYEDVCVICAGLWMGSWRGNSTMSYSTGNGSLSNWGSVRLEGDDDLTVDGRYVRNLGMGIEGRPVASTSVLTEPPFEQSLSNGNKRSSNLSWSSGRATLIGPVASGSDNDKGRLAAASTTAVSEDGYELDNQMTQRREQEVRTTLDLLRTFHEHTISQVSQLERLLPSITADEPSTALPRTVNLSLKDVMSFELGPLSGLDARYLEWLADEYGGGVKLVVKRGWREVFGLVFGYG